MIANNTSLMERLGFVAGVILMVLLSFNTAAPYICAWQAQECVVPDSLIRLLDQNQNTIQNLAIYLFGFLFGTSVGKRLSESTLDTQAKTIADAQAALAPLASTTAPDVTLKPGQTATVAASEDKSNGE
jgi:hypothetical protein